MTEKMGWAFDLYVGFRMYCKDVFEASAVTDQAYIDSLKKSLNKKIDEINTKYKKLDYIVSINKIDTEYDACVNDIFLICDATVLCGSDKGRKNAEKFCKRIIKEIKKWNKKGHKSKRYKTMYNVARSCNGVAGEAVYFSNRISRLREYKRVARHFNNVAFE